MRISDWSSDVCSSDLSGLGSAGQRAAFDIGAVLAVLPGEGERAGAKLVQRAVARNDARKRHIMAIGVNGRVGAMQNNIMTCRKIAGRSKSAAVDGHIARTQRSGCTGTYNRMINDKAAAEAVVAIQCQSPTAEIGRAHV